MRKFQISINFHFLKDDKHPVILDVYADSNNAWETVCAGFSELLNELQGQGLMTLPSFGRRDHYWSGFEKKQGDTDKAR